MRNPLLFIAGIFCYICFMAKVKLLTKYQGLKKGSIIEVKSTEIPYLQGMGIAHKYSGKTEGVKVKPPVPDKPTGTKTKTDASTPAN